MDTIQSISTEFEKVAQKQLASQTDMDATLQSLIQTLTAARETILASPPTTAQTLALLKQKATASAKLLSSQQEEVRRAAMKHDKSLRAAFKTDLDEVWDPRAFDGLEAVLDKTLASHFIREGRFGVADTFVEEGGLDVPDGLQDRFREMYTVLERIRERDLDPAIAWARECRKAGTGGEDLALEFALLKLRFVQLLSGGHRDEAIGYAKESFKPFATSHIKDIRRLMGAVLYAQRLPQSPYSDLLDPSAWHDVQHRFTRSFCLRLGLSPDSPLYVSVLVGTLALPTIVKMSSIMKDRSGLEWSQAGELPVEIPLSVEQRFHSVFACPVSKEQSTADNPPMLMHCGHVICKFCLDRLSKGSVNTRFKCPYCPVESTAGQANRIHL
ncbi:hypothetical protein HKX48_009321 [Thoreauomyces humboldtii]|nr:hypothetical protein HKX48_009321 [Thoreauomyces humboldtii]